ncbi:MAG TPA: hypothetical protein VLX92_28135 [Kofleriaceae bacterium]|nr:hypothetical protein [Kofleriaceae bacterium]
MAETQSMRDKPFRQTLWFKKGIEESAQAPADPEAPSAKQLPVEDRYLDDGSVTTEDSAMFGVHTGATQHMPFLEHGVARPTMDRIPVLVGELKRGRRTVLAAIGAALAVVIVIAAIAL